MGAMLVGMATGIPVMIFVVFCTIVQAVVIAFCAYKNKMSVKWWLFAALVLNSFVLIPFVFAIVKIRTAKCQNCGTKLTRNTNFCPDCNESSKVFDDESFIRKIMIVLAVAFAVFEFINAVWITIVGLG